MSAPATCPTFDPSDLNLSEAEPIGRGAVSHVVCSRLSTASRGPIAVKIVSKVQLLHQKKVQSAMNEKQALLELGPHPFVVRLHGTAQSTDELYFVMEHLPHGDLLEHIRTCAARSCIGASEDNLSCTEEPHRLPAAPSTCIRCLDFHDIQLITAQLVVGLSRVFAKGFVLRDLKPENIAFDLKYRACLLDFDTIDIPKSSVVPQLQKNVALLGSGTGAGSRDEPRRRLTVSEIQAMRKMSANFCGTAQYVSPEMVGKCEWSYSSDLWALGAIVYEMMYGMHMFSGCNTFAVMKRVLGDVHSGKVSFPRVYLGPETDAFERVKDFILKLCRTDPTCRLGVHPVTGRFDEEALRRHPLFGDFSWDILDEHVKRYRPPSLIGPEGSAVGTLPAVPGPLYSHVLDDGTGSLESNYHVVPVHSPEYAKYVFEETADANPFERWMQTSLEDGQKEEKEEAPGCGEDADVGAASIASVDEKGSVVEGQNNGDSSSHSEMDVIDDVGMQFFGNVHPDFGGMA